MIIEEWVRHIAESRFENFDTEVVEQTKYRIIDVVGCMIGGANAPGCSMVRDLVKEWGGQPQATILVHGVKAPAHNVAMVNSIMARSFDYEVVSIHGDHVSATTVPTAIAVAEWKHIGGKEFITALILGDDITTRLRDASNYIPDMNWEASGTMNRFGTTAIAGKLLGLNEHQMLNAFGIILDQLAGSFQSYKDGAHCFKLPQGLSARDGIITAELANKGWTGVKDPLLSKCGYFALYCQTYHTEILTKELGKKFYADCKFKPYPSCDGIHSTIECTLNLVNEHDIKVEDIDEVTVNVAPARRDSTLGQPFRIGDFPQVNALFNLRYNVANVLVRKGVKLEHFTEEFIRDPKVFDLTKKVTIISTIPSDKLRTAEVTVRMKDGREHFAHVAAPKGDPIEKPLTKEEIEEKFRTNVAFSKTVTNENAEAALDMLKNLEEIDDITKVVKLLVAQ